VGLRLRSRLECRDSVGFDFRHVVLAFVRDIQLEVQLASENKDFELKRDGEERRIVGRIRELWSLKLL
jgi:hypothetical protein